MTNLPNARRKENLVQYLQRVVPPGKAVSTNHLIDFAEREFKATRFQTTRVIQYLNTEGVFAKDKVPAGDSFEDILIRQDAEVEVE